MKKLITAVSLAVAIANPAQAQMFFTPAAIDNITPQMEFAQMLSTSGGDLPIEIHEAPLVIHMMLPEPAKPTLKQRVMEIGSKIKRLPAAIGHGLKAIGHGIVVLNDKCAPAIRVVNSGTTVGGAYYFWTHH